GTGAGVDALRGLCERRVTGVDFSAGMLAAAGASAAAGRERGADPERAAGPVVDWVRADARALPFAPVFDLAVSFGAFGHFLPAERPALFAQARAALRPGGLFVFPVPAPPPVGSKTYLTLWGFDTVMRLRNLLWHPPFVMYYRTFPLRDVLADLDRTGFRTALSPLTGLGVLPGGAPRCVLVVARRT
ncbi:class I SAM-dependent methyltransferase, partial [Streptomyces corynorhini]